MPPLYVIDGQDGFVKDTPIFWGEDGALDPLLLDVVSETAEGLGLCLNAEAHEHKSDFVVRQERKGHEFADKPVGCVVVALCGLDTKLLHLW